jgi:hypothetical protein
MRLRGNGRDERRVEQEYKNGLTVQVSLDLGLVSLCKFPQGGRDVITSVGNNIL